MPAQRTSTPVSNATRTGPISRLQGAPYPLSRPQSGTRSTPATARPRTARPRTATSTTGNDTNVIAAVTEGIDRMNLTDLLGRGSAVCVGLCFLSLDTGECILSQVLCNCGRRLTQICDSQTYGKTIHKLAVFDPLEVYNALSVYPDPQIVLPETNIGPEKSKLCQIIEENLPGASIVSGARKFFREDLGMEYINQVTAY
jgi:DNA mismatch repair protein MSH4